MQKKLDNLGALLISNPINIRYLTGFVGAEPQEHEVFVLLYQKEMYLFTNSLYIERAKQLANQRVKLHVIQISRDKPLSTTLKSLLTELKIKTLGFEEINLTFAEYNNLKTTLYGVSLTPTQNKIESLRSIKRTDEIENIRYACEITDECFTYIIKQLKNGVTETEIAWKIESFFRQKGAESAFSPIVAYGKNSSQPHYQPSNNQRLTNNTLVLLDFGAKFNGYCADMTRVVFFGRPNKIILKAYNTVLKAQLAAIKYFTVAASPISGKNADAIAREIIKKAGFIPYSHSLGHAVGLAIHEDPRITVKKDAHLKPGMAITIEPAIYQEGKFGIRIEDLVLLQENGIEVLTKSLKAITVL